MKKLLSLSLCLLMLLSFSFFGCNNLGEKESFKKSKLTKYIEDNEIATIWGAPNTVSIMKDLDVKTQCDFWGEEWLDSADKIHVEGLKGDVEATQIMITAKSKIKSFDLKADDLVAQDGSKIEKTNIEVLAERYIETINPSSQSNTASMFTGWFPDALVPINSYKMRRENVVEADENQGIWVNISIPTDSKAGLYTGEFTLMLDSNSYKIPVSVYVYDVAMSSITHAKTAYGIDFKYISNGEEYEDEDGNYTDWNTIYYEYLLSKKLTPQCTYNNRQILDRGQLTSSLKADIDDMVEGARNGRVTMYKLPYGVEKISLNGVETNVCDYYILVQLFKALASRNIELINQGEDINLFKKGYFYFGTLIDEPSIEKLPAVKECDKRVTRAKKEVADTLGDYPELQDALLRIPHIVTTHLNESFLGNEEDGGIQTWCCEAQNWNTSTLSSIRERQESTDRYSIGEGFWTYMTCTSNNPYPTLQMDDNLLAPRTLFWMNYKYHMNATLFWNTCFYACSPDGKREIKRDLWSNPNSWYTSNGDGYLLYPGTRYGLSTPIATLRLESIREGIEDYEALYMLEDALGIYNQKHGTSYEFDNVLKNVYSSVFITSTLRSQTNVANFANARVKLLKLLEAVSNDLPSAQSLLESM